MPSRLKLSPLRGSLAEQAYQAVRRMIVSGELPPGAAVARRPLAERLGVSFLPVSEALQRLEHEGLVESWPRVGTRVRVPTPQDVRGNYVIREALESQSARLYSEKASQAEHAEMGKLALVVDAMQADLRVDFFDYSTAHERFHRRLAECAGCPALVEAIGKTNTLIRSWQYSAVSEYRDMPPRWHQSLVDALGRGDAEAADRAMREHVRHGMEEVLHRMEPYLQASSFPPGEPARPRARAAVRGRR